MAVHLAVTQARKHGEFDPHPTHPLVRKLIRTSARLKPERQRVRFTPVPRTDGPLLRQRVSGAVPSTPGQHVIPRHTHSWRKWHTRMLEGHVSSDVRVRVPPSAPT